jgi:hypothetical protein
MIDSEELLPDRKILELFVQKREENLPEEVKKMKLVFAELIECNAYIREQTIQLELDILVRSIFNTRQLYLCVHSCIAAIAVLIMNTDMEEELLSTLSMAKQHKKNRENQNE